MLKHKRYRLFRELIVYFSEAALTIRTAIKWFGIKAFRCIITNF